MSSLSNASRINRAKQGIPTGGRLPYGRIYVWDDKTEQTGHWEIDKGKQSLIQDCAKRYLAGEALGDLSKEYNVSAGNLHRVLTRISGSTWELNISEVVVVLEVPPLLDKDTIEAIHKRIKSNQTFHHKPTKYQHVFARMIFCSHCECALTAQEYKGDSYYRHAANTECSGPKRKTWIPEKEIEMENFRFDAMTYTEKRQFCQTVFGGETTKGKRQGVWITWDDLSQKWTYQIEGT